MAELDHANLIRLRPRSDTLYISQGRVVFVTARDGCVPGGSPYGLFVNETRFLSKYRYLVNGRAPQLVAVSNVRQHSQLAYYVMTPGEINGRDRRPEGTQQVVELRVSRSVGGGVHEDLDLTNFTQEQVSFQLQLELDADFIDTEEAEGERRQFGMLTSKWHEAEGKWQLDFTYAAERSYSHQGETGKGSISRMLRVRMNESDSPPSYSEGAIAFAVTLSGHQKWHACIHFVARIETELLVPEHACYTFFGEGTRSEELSQMYIRESTKFVTEQSNSLAGVVKEALTRAKHDLAALRLFDLDHGDRAWVTSAGVPVYVALFGRDTLTAAWEAALAGSEILRGTLPELARWQGTEDSAWRDEQPGKMLHEAHTGPLAILGYNPRQRYYGAATTSAFYPVVVSEAWHWTGDKALISKLMEPCIRALKWLDQYSDLNADGFYEYQSRSEQGLKNQGWKDSGDAIVYEDGSQVEAPIATCEEQGFAYAAKLQLSEVMWWMDRKDEARKFYHEAEELKKRFNEAFWLADEKFFALALDRNKQPVKSIASNAGHCIATGIVDSALIRQTAARLFEADMFSGWGLRTLSSNHPAYNPYSYHRGSVWPVEHGSFAIGFMRYGLIDRLQTLSKALFEAATLFDFYRLPELFAGHPRDREHPFPALYPKANWPQAWSSSALFSLIQAMLGIYPYAPLNLLLVDPQLPDWLPEITLVNLRVGASALDISFHRESDGTSDYRILDKRGPLHIIRQPSPWSLTAGFGERLKDLALSLTPSRT